MELMRVAKESKVTCQECREHRRLLVTFREDDSEYYASDKDVCADCLRKALALIEAGEKQAEKDGWTG